MSNSGSGQDYTDPHSQSFATEGAATTAKKQPKPAMKLVIIVVGLLFLGLALFVGWGFISKKHAPAAAQQAQQAPQKTPETAPAKIEPAAPSTVAAPAAVDPGAALVVDTNGDGVADAPAAPTDPTASVPMDPNAAPTPASVAVPTMVDPSAAVATPQASVPTVPVLDPALSQPVAAVPATTANPSPVVESAPALAPVATTPPPVAVVQDPANSSIGQVMDTARQEMMSALNRIEQRLVNLEGRVSALENRPGSASAGVASVPGVSKPVRRHAVKKPVHRVAPRAVPSTPRNRIELIEPASPPVSHAIIIERSGSQVPSDNRIQVVDGPTVDRPASVSSCRIQSIKPGRAWVRRADGSFASYGVGDTLPNGAIVDSIDPDTGVIANGRPWGCN